MGSAEPKSPLEVESAAPSVPPKVAKPEKAKSVKYIELFRYATFGDRLALVIALLAALVNGAIFPILGILFGQLLNALNGPSFVADVNRYALYFLLLAIGSAFTNVIESVIPVVIAARLVSIVSVVSVCGSWLKVLSKALRTHLMLLTSHL